MDEAPRRPGGPTVLDAAALVTGGAVASVHFREFSAEIEALTPLGTILALVAFAWLGLTSAGPFVYLVRRFGRRQSDYPRPPDSLWMALGLPWTIGGLYRSAAGEPGRASTALYGDALFFGLAIASGLCLIRIARAWSTLDDPSRRDGPGRTWTEWIGSVVAVAWPVQFGLGFLLTR